ncbi:MAG: uncharacterized protein A8A55_3110, partial [Amphiamblys sp. WSBS2006]
VPRSPLRTALFAAPLSCTLPEATSKYASTFTWTIEDFVRLHQYLSNECGKIKKINILQKIGEKDTRSSHKLLSKYILVLFSDIDTLQSSFLFEFLQPDSPLYTPQSGAGRSVFDRDTLKTLQARQAVLRPADSQPEAPEKKTAPREEQKSVLGGKEEGLLFNRVFSLVRELFCSQRDGWLRSGMLMVAKSTLKQSYAPKINKKASDFFDGLVEEKRLCGYLSSLLRTLEETREDRKKKEKNPFAGDDAKKTLTRIFVDLFQSSFGRKPSEKAALILFTELQSQERNRETVLSLLEGLLPLLAKC